MFNFGQCEELKPSTNYLKNTESDMKFSLNWMDPNIFNDIIFPEKTDVVSSLLLFVFRSIFYFCFFVFPIII